MRDSTRIGLRIVQIGSLLVAGAAALGVVGGRSYAPLRFEPQPFAIAEPMESGRTYDHDVWIINDNDFPTRLVGVSEYCASSCFASQGLPLSIPARGRARVNLHVEARVPGPLEESLNFFTDRPEQPRLGLEFRGNVVAPQPPNS
ncbi:MAG: hypothetical protein SFX72_07880 [Isosphaeraceae bacterium]|nr:hypothetical protein [Isosphaeraceae bacterium]